MGILDFFHAACAHTGGLVLLHLLSCLVGATGYLLAWLPQQIFRHRYGTLAALVVASIAFGTWVLFSTEFWPGVLQDSDEFAAGAKMVSLVAGTLFLVGATRFIIDYLRTGDQEALLFLSLALLFAMADFAFASSNLWSEQWWSWHVTRLVGFSMACGFVVRGYLRNAADVRWSLLEQKKVQRLLRRRTRELVERIQELNCLYRFYRLVQRPGMSLDAIFEGVLAILHPSLGHHERLGVRLVYEQKEFKTEGFRETKWFLCRPIRCCQEPIGFIEVCYQSDPDPLLGPLFPREERQLLEAVSDHLSATIQRKRLETEIAQVSTWERQRFGRELHDELGQELTGLGYLAQCLYLDLDSHAAAEAETARKLSDGLQVSISKTRLLSQGQALAHIAAVDFVPSLERIAALAQERWGVSCQVTAHTRIPFRMTAMPINCSGSRRRPSTTQPSMRKRTASKCWCSIKTHASPCRSGTTVSVSHRTMPRARD